jgi:hypothetical protein
VAWALLGVLRPAQESLARLAAWLRAAYAAALAVAAAHVLVAVELVETDGIAADTSRAVNLELVTSQTTWDVGLLLLGLHRRPSPTSYLRLGRG